MSTGTWRSEMRGSGITSSVLFLGLLLTGCEREDLGSSGQVALPGAPMQVTNTPHLVVGEDGSQEEQTFHRVTSPFLLPGNRLAVPLAGENVIRVFDAEGGLVVTHGGLGEGPGEFVALAAAWADGDVIEAFDSRQARITRFGPGGEIDVIRLRGGHSAQAALPRLEDGSRVLYGVTAVASTGRDRMSLHHFSSTGEHRTELLEFQGMRRYAFPGGSGPDPLSPRGVLRVHGSEVYVAETTDPRIQVLGLASGERRVIEWDADRTRFPGDAVTAGRQAALAHAGSDEARARVEERFDALTGEESVSSFWDFLVDDEGFIWLRPFDPTQHGVDVGGLTGPGPGGTWIVLSPDGHEVGTVEVPADLELSVITSEAVVGIRRDDLGVESVRVHRLERVPETGR